MWLNGCRTPIHLAGICGLPAEHRLGDRTFADGAVLLRYGSKSIAFHDRHILASRKSTLLARSAAEWVCPRTARPSPGIKTDDKPDYQLGIVMHDVRWYLPFDFPCTCLDELQVKLQVEGVGNFGAQLR
jgi:hypothetical protein